MGSHRKQSRIRRKYLLPTAAVPALAGMAATVCLAPQALADPAPAHAAAQSVTVTDTRSYTGLAPAELLAAVQPATGQTRGSAQAVSYTVRSGDSLSSIAGRFYHKQNAWPVLYWANHSKVHWANVLGVGQVLKIPAKPAKIPLLPGRWVRPPRRRPPRSPRAPGPARRTHPRRPRPWRRAATRAARPAARSASA